MRIAAAIRRFYSGFTIKGRASPFFRPALAAVLLVPLLTTAVLSGDRSLTGDEALTVFATSNGMSVLLDNVSLDNHPPLYYMLMMGWRSVFGDSLGSLRLFALVPAALAVVLSALFLTPLTAALMGFSPFLLHLGVELRMYGLLALVGLVQILAMRYELKRGSFLSLILLSLALSAATWVHHFGWPGVAAALSVLILRKHLRRARRSGHWRSCSTFRGHPPP